MMENVKPLTSEKGINKRVCVYVCLGGKGDSVKFWQKTD